jgi:hypothetical protein
MKTEKERERERELICRNFSKTKSESLTEKFVDGLSPFSAGPYFDLHSNICLKFER